jgi:hypothetical protein
MAQDAAVVAPKKNKTTWTQKDIRVDNDSINARHFPKDFKTKYQSDEFQYKARAHNKNAWDRFTEWLTDLFRRLFDFDSNESSRNFVNVLMKVVAVLIILFVIYLIVKSIMNKEGQWIFGRNSDKKIIRYDEIEKNLHLVDFEKRIQEALKSGEKRLCIRYYYLFLLKKMSEKHLIAWDAEKTNSDYLHEITNETLKNDFSYLSYLYNYIWYGEFTIDETAFERAKTAFEKTIQSI